jgi:hypothetical protein
VPGVGVCVGVSLVRSESGITSLGVLGSGMRPAPICSVLRFWVPGLGSWVPGLGSWVGFLGWVPGC